MILISMRRLFGLIILAALGYQSQAQLTVDINMSPTQMAQNLVGEGVDIFNVQVTAADSSYGYYYSTNTEIGTSEGILLSTGKAINAIGPNDETGLPQIDSQGNCVTCDEYDNNFAGNPLLSLANGGLNTWDACLFEFDIVPQGDSLKFDFVFGSEEYLEWVGSPFNDVFGFFISGPGVGVDVNIALVPGTSTPVAINTVNNISNTSYFYNNQNPLGQGIQFDGFTQNLKALVGSLTPCETYHLKLIIADGSDRIYDSGVFISRIESNPVTILTSTAGGVDYMIEGCNDGLVTFESSFIPTTPFDVIFTIGGDAEMGVDYTTDPDLNPFYNAADSTYTLTILPGDSTVSFDINTIFDNIDEGSEYVIITLLEQLCDTILFNSQVNFEIIDSLTVIVHPDSGEICPGNCIQLTGEALTEGSATYFWDPTDGLDNPNSLTPVACPTETTTYVLTSMISECIGSDSITVTVTDLMLSFVGNNVPCIDGAYGEIDLTVLNGLAPYTFDWTGPNSFTASSEDITDLEAGTYCVTVTDDAGCSTTECFTIIEENVLDVSLVGFSDFTCFPISCAGECDGAIDISVSGGSGLYTFDWTGPSFTSSDEDINGLCAGTYTVTVTDENGCMVTDSWTLNEPQPLEVQLDGVVDVLCSGEQTGSACVTSTGGCTPYFYEWSHDANLTAPCAINLGSATYFASVSDVNGCTSADSVEIFVGEPGTPILIVLESISIYPGGYNVSCPDAADGSVDVTVSGGIPGYTYFWSDDNGLFVSNAVDLSNVPCGTYTLTVTDSNDCQESLEVELTCVPDIEITYTTIQNPCGSPNAGQGEIHITSITGGHGGAYTTSWTGPSCPCSGLDLLGLDSGDYTLEVTDVLGCVMSFVINIGENQDFTLNESVTDASCFNECDGEIDITVIPELGTEVYSWIGPDGFISSDADIVGLCPGDYQLTLVQGACQQQFNYSVAAPPDIEIDIIEATPPSCFGQNDGQIEIAVSGGTGLLTIDWAPVPGCFFPGSSDPIISTLTECDYTVTVTDATGCSLTQTISLIAPQVMDLFVSTSIFDGGFNISCAGSQDGAISVTVNGGSPDCIGFAPYCYSYDWSDCDDVSLYGNDPNSPNLTALAGGSYCVNVTDSNGCLATTTINMAEPDSIDTAPNVSDYNGFNISCLGAMDGWVAPNISGGSGTFVEYDWISGDIGANDPQADTLFNLGPGEYCLYLYDTNGCSDTSCFTLVEPQEISITIDNVTQVTCYGYSDGSISVTATGGAGGYVYEWEDEFGDPVGFGNLLTGLPAGTYVLTVTDVNGCTATETVILDEPPFFGVSLTAPVQGDSTIFILQCTGDTNASIISLVEGGDPDYLYSWEDCDMNFISNAPTISGLGAGCYCLTVTDSQGCETQSCLDITEPDDSLMVDPIVSLYPGDYNISCAGAGDGWIDLITTGGVPNYTYVWHANGDTTIISINNMLDDLGPGSYDVLVTDANGCDTTLFLDLIEPPAILINPSVSLFDGGSNVSCYGVCDGSISIEPVGGVPSYTVLWADPLNTDSLNVDSLCAGSYTVSVTDSIGCEIIQVVDILEPDSMFIVPSIVDIDCFNNDNGELCAATSGGNSGGGYTYAWTPNVGNTECVTGLEPGQYCVTVTDTNGCEATDCWTLDEPTELSLSWNTTPSNCGACDGAIDVTGTGGTGALDYDWTGPDTVQGQEDQNSLCADVYSLTITDENGCEATEDIEVDGPELITVQESIDNPACYGDCDGMISLVLSNAVAPVEIIWMQGNLEVGSGEILEDICNGTFDVLIEDADGCTAEFQYSVIEPDSITINGWSPFHDNGYNVSEFDGNDGSIDTDVMGGTPGYTYEWSGPATIDDGVENPGDLVAGEYMLTITDSQGCVKDTLIVLIQPFDLTLPNGLSPNGDGLNDYFVILGVEEHPDNVFIVFNRWGNIVYEKSGYNNEWYGQNMDGNALPDGTYYVIFEADDRTFNTFVDLRR
jgi:gliding motility-associated-like protein